MAQVRILFVAAPQVVEPLRNSLLARKDFSVRQTASGIDAFNLIKFEHPDLAFVDIALEDEAGDLLCRDVKSDPTTKETFVAVLVEQGDDWFAKRARDAGADAVLAKPLKTEEVAQVIAKVAGQPIRRAVRIPVRIKVDGATSMGEMRGESLDLSISGLLMRMKECELEKGYAVWLKFQISPESAPVVCKAEVVRVVQGSGEYQVGVKFTSFTGSGGDVLRKALREMQA